MVISRFLTVLWIVVIALTAAAGGAAAQEAQPAAPDTPLTAAFTYQGSLRSGESPASGAFDFQFILYNAASGGSQVGAIQSREDVAVANGIFTVDLDFGAASFDGQARWLEVGVRPGASTGAYSILSPRHPLTAVPYALYAAAAPWSGLQSVPAGFADGVDNDTTYAAGTGLTLTGTTLAADAAYLQRRVAGTCAAGSSIRVVNSDGTVACETDDSGWSLTGNAGTAPGTHFLGTTDNQALELKVNGQRALRLEPVTATLAANAGAAPSREKPERAAAGDAGTGAIPPSPLQPGRSAAAGDAAAAPLAVSGINVIAGYSGNSVASGQVGQTVAGGGSDLSSCGVSGSEPCVNKVTAAYGTVSGGLGNNTAGTAATVSGGSKNTASGYQATVGGGYGNYASGSWSLIAGGEENSASGEDATVAGGYENTASGYQATVGGGGSNTASSYHATVGGGGINTASSYYATVGGGSSNTAGGDAATVGGGYGNDASGEAATVPGGNSNVAQGSYSLAAGRRAKTYRNGVFVWADGSDFDFDPWTWGPAGVPNSFNVRSTGGLYFATGIDTAGAVTTGVYVSAGGSGWNAYSDRNAKESIEDVDVRSLLDRLAGIPIQTWSYKSQVGVRHIGPMSQDFRAAFRVGENDTTINSVDADGVALAAIQGLYQVVQEQEARIAAQQEEIRGLEARNTAIENRLAALEQAQGPVPAHGSLPANWLLLGGLLTAAAVAGRRRLAGGA